MSVWACRRLFKKKHFYKLNVTLVSVFRLRIQLSVWACRRPVFTILSIFFWILYQLIPILIYKSFFFSPAPAFYLFLNHNCLSRVRKRFKPHQNNWSPDKSITISIFTRIMFKNPPVNTVCHPCIVWVIWTFDNVDIIEFHCHFFWLLHTLRQAQRDIGFSI